MFIPLIEGKENGKIYIWYILIISWGTDVFAFLIGNTFKLGKHKFSKISPKKSIEGSIGGIVGSAIVGFLFGYFLLDKAMGGYMFGVALFVIGAIGSVISQVGDLAASAIKRNHGIKDYGHLIPGHGGIMDRFDSVIFTAPMVYFLIILFFK